MQFAIYAKMCIVQKINYKRRKNKFYMQRNLKIQETRLMSPIIQLNFQHCCYNGLWRYDFGR